MPVLLLAGLLLPSAGCNSMNSQTCNAEGVRLYSQGSFDQAAVKFGEAVAANPDSADAYYNQAAALQRAGTLYNRPQDLKQAEVLYNQCLERDPNQVECYRGLAVLLTETNRRDAAFRLLNNWSASSPDNPDPKIELARLLEESGQPDQAMAQLVAALEVSPDNARAFTALGRLRDQSGNYQLAMANYQRSLSLNSNQPQVAARVAALQATMGGQAPMSPGGAPPPQVANQWQSSGKY
jgi:tetratricopeptide (TPR) repeat protein